MFIHQIIKYVKNNIV